MEQQYWLGRKRAAIETARHATTAVARLIHLDLAGRFSVKAARAGPAPAARKRGPAGARPVLCHDQKPVALICDDDDLTLDVLTHHLTHAGYEVARATDGRIALELLDEQLPDVIILAVMIPGVDGIEVLKRIRATAAWRNIPVVMLTYRSGEEDVVRALQAGASDYITKPFSVGELIERVKRLVTPHEHPLESLILELEARPE